MWFKAQVAAARGKEVRHWWLAMLPSANTVFSSPRLALSLTHCPCGSPAPSASDGMAHTLDISFIAMLQLPALSTYTSTAQLSSRLPWRISQGILPSSKPALLRTKTKTQAFQATFSSFARRRLALCALSFSSPLSLSFSAVRQCANAAPNHNTVQVSTVQIGFMPRRRPLLRALQPW